MTGTEIYKRTATYDKEARGIRLHAPQWKVLLAFDGQRSLSEVALNAESSFADTVPLTQTFLDKNWIAEEPITLDQFLKRSGAPDISSLGAAVPPAQVLHSPEAVKAAPAPVSTPPPTPRPVAVAATPKPVPTSSSPPPLPVPTPRPVAVSSESIVKTPRGGMKLSAVVDFITSLSSNISLGQLLVYRVFLRVPPDLLLSEDIASVHLANDTSVINSERLQKAIADAVNAVARKTLPDSVYATT